MSRKISDNEWEDAMRGMNEPPEVPRDRMWQAIDDARREKRQVVQEHKVMKMPEQRRSAGVPVWRLVAATAAVLVFGVAIGRMSVTPTGPGVTSTMVVETEATSRSTTNPVIEKQVYRLAAADLFGRADFLLTDFKVRNCDQQDVIESPSWASGMLLQTRLLLDTPIADDREMHQLLEELELVLAQIIGLSRENCASDMAWIKKGLQERSTLGRLRMMSDSRALGAL